MTNNEYRKAIKGVIYLCKCGIMEVKPNRSIVKTYNIQHLYEASKRHTLTAMVGLALQSCGLANEEFRLAIASAQRKNILLENDKQLVFDALDESNIWHMALKGTIIRNWYPQWGMRESADCDILFDKTYEEKVKDIMLDLGYSVESFGGGHHDVYFKKPVTNMQMHVELFGVGFEQRLNRYYSNVEKRLEKGRGYELFFTPEDFYIYMLSHNYRDYSNAGTGLRSLFDTYIVLKHFKFNWKYIKRETEKLCIRDFEIKNRHLVIHLLEEEKLTDEDKKRLRYMINSGTYGSTYNLVNNKVNSLGGTMFSRMKYAFERFSVPLSKTNPQYRTYKTQYPFFYKHISLLPILPFYRLFHSLRKSKSRILTEIRTLIRL